MSVTIKHDILEVMQDCMSILSRNRNEDPYQLEETLAHMETAYKLIEASQIHFKPILTDEITIH